jgi:hypothetical protein
MDPNPDEAPCRCGVPALAALVEHDGVIFAVEQVATRVRTVRDQMDRERLILKYTVEASAGDPSVSDPEQHPHVEFM